MTLGQVTPEQLDWAIRRLKAMPRMGWRKVWFEETGRWVPILVQGKAKAVRRYWAKI